MKSKTENPELKIAVAGAGPAGASLAIRLAKANFEVTLIERERFPRQKLCGEFISPECLRHFRQLGVLDEMLSAGGERISETVFYAANGKSAAIPSEWFDGGQSALSLSRAEMDSRLLEKAKNGGVKILEESQATGLVHKNKIVSGLKVKKSGETTEISADLFIDATGRAGILAKLAERSNLIEKPRQTRNSTRLIGFKNHLENAHSERNHCEIYSFNGGYGGLSHVENNLANFCFLIKAETVKNYIGQTDLLIEKVVFQNRRARKALENANPVYDWLAVSVDEFGVKNPNPLPNVFSIGDAAAFIDPFTGSGMLMALESAELLANVITENQFSPAFIGEKYKIRHRLKFRKRLRISSLLRRAAYVPALANLTISLLNLSDKSREIIARATRQKNLKADG